MISLIGSFLRYASVVGQIPFLHYFLAGNPLLPVIFPAVEAFNPAVNFAIKCVTEAEKEDALSTQQDDYFTRLKRLSETGSKGGLDGGPFGPADIINHTSTNVLACSDTTAIALRSIIHNVITNTISYRKLQQEIDEMDQQGLLSNPVKEAEARKMPYLQAVIKEAMRLHPSVGVIMERHVPKGGAVICNTYLPAGTVVGINPWVVGRNPTVYGKDVDTFRPERWLEADPEQLKAMERASAGSRVCLGKNISLMVRTRSPIDKPALTGFSQRRRCAR
jgi:cytochrome P450